MFIDNFAEEIRKAKDLLEANILSGQPSDFANYKFLVGRLHGLQTAIDICNKLLK